MDSVKKIIIISDGTGQTAKRLLDAVLAQYTDHQDRFAVENIYPEVRTRKRIEEILKSINSDYLVIYSMVSEDLSNYLHSFLEEQRILHLNVLEPMLQTMWKFLGVHPVYTPGLLQIIDDRYYRKVDAIGYTAEHDDGRGHRLAEAELVLVGPSRTCKTPISMYTTCNYGLRVANIPIVPHPTMKEQLLERLSRIDPKITFGLLMQPDALMKVREERAELLSGSESGLRHLKGYQDLQEIREELRFCRLLYEEQGWTALDVTSRAIEEVALDIVRRLKTFRNHRVPG